MDFLKNIWGNITGGSQTASPAPSPFAQPYSGPSPFQTASPTPSAPVPTSVPKPVVAQAPKVVSPQISTFGGTAALPNTYNYNSSTGTAAVNPNIPAYTPPTKIYPVNFNVPVPDTIDSSMFGSKPAPSTLDSTYNSKLLSLMNGTDTSSVPSDNLYSTLAGNIYAASKYTPEEQAQLQNYADITSRINADTLASRRQIKQLQEDGQLTKEQAASFISESQRRSDAQLADLSVAQSSSALSLGVLGQIRGNNLTAYQNLAGMLKPEQVSPGSTLYNPVTGVNYQGTGAAPAQILSSAQQLEQVAMQNGTLQYNSDGSVNHNAYIQQAQQFYSSGQIGNSYGGGQGGTNQLQQIAQMLVGGQLSPSNIPQGMNQAAVLNAANQLSIQTTGKPFNANEAQANYAATQSALTQNATTFRALSNAQATAVTHLDDLNTYFLKIPSTKFPIINNISNWIQGALGSQELQSYNTALQAARGEIAKVLAGGGAPSDADKLSANAVLPDNMSPGQLAGAISSAKLLMQQKITEYSNTGNVPQYGSQQSNTSKSLYNW